LAAASTGNVFASYSFCTDLLPNAVVRTPSMMTAKIARNTTAATPHWRNLEVIACRIIGMTSFYGNCPATTSWLTMLERDE